MPSTTAERTLKRLVDDYRDDCLWFLRRDYYPSTVVERLAVLDAIEQNGNLEAYRRARQLKEWL